MLNMGRLQVVDVCRATEGFAPSGFCVCRDCTITGCDNDLTANNATPATTARPIPTPHPGPSPSQPVIVLALQTWDDGSGFVSTACSLLFSWKTVSFAAASSAFSVSIFCWRTAAPLRPASCFLGSFCFFEADMSVDRSSAASFAVICCPSCSPTSIIVSSIINFG